ncbi:MAG TPA: type II toxin-antitoxin system VapC family toxin [Acidobacteriaceae bacterium]|jgi:PIN domain nuclease of toxin-antitoxin system|nr:type II toxin-antitoxin system VapC family toxin [Acidobacteriaceae bacterium]
MRKSRPRWRTAIRILLDTQAFILGYLGLLSRKLLDQIEGPEHEWILSAASVAEIAVKHAIGKLDMPEAETVRAIRELNATVLAVEEAHALRMFSLPLHHRDPFDRMILATALAEKLPIVTGDRVFRRHPQIQVIW